MVSEEYVDDDVSAYSGKTRPSYQRMLDHIRDKQHDAGIVWHMDRLHRRPIKSSEGGLADALDHNCTA